MAPERLSTRRYRCRFCGLLLNTWLPAAKEANGALLLQHLGQQHRDRVGAYTARMHTTDDITPVALEAYERVEEDEGRQRARPHFRLRTIN